MKRILLLIVALVICSMSYAQLTGTKNIPGDYADLATAITDLNTLGVGAGGVTINLLAGNPQTAPAGGYAITTLTGTLANPIVITGNSNTITASAALTVGALNDAIFKVIGADYITIQGFSMQENAANTVTTAASNNMTEFGVALFYATVTDGAKNITIQNNTITLVRTYQNTFGIYSNVRHSATAISTAADITNATGANDYTKIYSNNISAVNQGIVIVGSTTAAYMNTGIDVGGSSLGTANTISNYGTTGTFSGYISVSGSVMGINLNNCLNSNVSYNTVTCPGLNTAGTVYGIYFQASGTIPTTGGPYTYSILRNTLSIKSGLIAGTIYGINAAPGNSVFSYDINYNDFNNFGHTVAGSGTIYCLNAAGGANVQNINYNTFTSLSVNTTGSVYMLYYNASLPLATSTQFVTNNSIVGTFAKTGAGGTVYCMYTNASSVAGSTKTIANNTFSNITLTGATALTGFTETDGGTPTKSIYNNTLSNVTGGTSAIIGLTFNYGIDNVYSNTFSNIAGGGAITVMACGGSSTTLQNVYSNVISGISSTGASAIYGIQSSASGTSAVSNIYRNSIFNISGSNASSSIYGIYVSTGTTINTYNNFVSDLRTPAANAGIPLVGIYVSGGTTSNVFYNSVYLSATSSGALFGSAALYASTTPTLDMRNNVLVNVSTPNGAGVTAAYRRSGVAITSYSANSNANAYYAGATEDATHAVYYNGTTPYAIADFKTHVGPSRDAVSFRELPPFLNVATTPYNLHISTSIATYCESGALAITTPIAITKDFDDDTRTATPDVGADEFTGIAAGVINPGAFAAAVISSQQINLSYTLNPSSNTVVVVWNSTGTFTAPAGSPPGVGNALAGGTVLSQGTTLLVSHTGLTPATPYYYKAFSWDGAAYSAGSTATATPSVAPPTALTATAVSTSQINLAYTLNAQANNVIIATAATSTFGVPVNGTTYVATNPITGGGTVIYVGPLAAFNHTGLTSNTAYYYKVWSYDAFAYYSATGAIANATTKLVVATPYLEGFATTSVPTGYTTTGWSIGAITAVGGNPLNSIYKNLYGSAATGTFTTVDVGPVTSGMFLSFDYKLADFSSPYAPPAAGSGNYVVSVSTDYGVTYTDLETVTNNAVAGWQIKQYDLTAYAGPQVKVKIVGNWVSGDYYLAFDNIKIEVPPSCPAPATLLATPAGFSANLAWTETGTATLWDIEWGAAGFTLGTGTQILGVTNPYTLTGLSPVTGYAYYVRANCGGSLLSTWSGPKTFTTLVACPAPTVLTAVNPTTTSVDLGWTENGAATTWEIEWGPVGFAQGTGTMVTGVATNPYTLTGLTAGTSYAFFVRAYCSGSYQSTWVGPKTFSTALCLPANQCNWTADLVDDYGDGWDGTVLGFKQGGVVVATFGNGFTSGFTYGPVNAALCDGLSTQIVVVSLGSYVGEKGFTIKDPFGTTVFNWAVGGTFTAGTVFYTFNSYCTPPSCPDPTLVALNSATSTSATIGWTAGGAETAWEYVYGVSPVTPPTGAGTATTSNPLTISGLSASTTYQFYVRANCATSFSNWVGPISFTTACASTASINEPFDGVTAPALPGCWSKYISPGFSFQTVGTYATAPNSSPNSVQLYSSGALLATDAPMLISPPMTGLNSGNKQLSFFAKGASTNVSVIVGTMTDPMNSATFTPFATVTGLSTSTYTQYTVDFATYAGTDTYIAFQHPLTTTYSYIYIDDVVFEVPPTCKTPVVPLATPGNFYANLSWTQTGTPISWDIEYGATPYTFTGIPTITGVTNPYTLTGLSALTGYTYKVRANCGAGDYSTWSVAKPFTTLIACPPPSALSATPLDPNKEDINWTENGSATTWDIELGLTGFTATGTPTSGLAGVTSHPYTLTGLTAATSYSFYVRSGCGSTWTGPFTFVTLCDVSTLPFGTQDFEGTFAPVCWGKATGALAAPTVFTSTTTSSWIQDDYRNVTAPVNKSARDNIYSTGHYGWLLTPQIDLGAGSATLRLEFDLALTDFANSSPISSDPNGTTGVDDKFVVVISTDGGATWTSANTLKLWDNAGSANIYNNISDLGQHEIINLAGYSGVVRFGFYGESTISNADNDLFVDNVYVGEPPSCFVPTGLAVSAITGTTATINWTAAVPAPANGYTWEVRTGGLPGSGSPVASGSTAAGVTTANITGLTSSTSYSVYVRSYCGGALGYSAWTAAVPFQTTCVVVTAPFIQDFSGTTFAPVCWAATPVSGTYNWVRNATVNGYGAVTGTGAARANFYSQSAGTYDLISLDFNASAMATPKLKFDYAYATYTGGELDQMDVYYSTDFGATWTLLLAMPGGPTGILNTGGTSSGTFVPTAGQWASQSLAIPVTANKVKFTAISAWGNDLYLDNVKVFQPLTLDAAAISIDMLALTTPGSIVPKATIKNEGTNTVTFPVTMAITGGYSNTQSVTLLGGASTQVSFAPWTAAVGTYTATVTTNLTGDLDPSNNSKTLAVAIEVLTKFYAVNGLQTGYFYKEHPETWVTLATLPSTNEGLYAGTWADGKWYASEYYDATLFTGGGWYQIDETTGVATQLAPIGTGFTGITYDHTASIMYGITWDGTTNSLYTIVPTTGVKTFKGNFSAGELMINLATDGSGFLYSLGITTDHLFKINATTLAVTDVGATGLAMNYAQDMEYDYASSTMYAATYTTVGQLHTVNLTTGACTLVGAFAGNAELAGLAIPYTSNKTLNLTSIFLEGLYTGPGTMHRAANDLGYLFTNPLVADQVTVELHNATYSSIAHTFSNVDLSTTGVISIPTVPPALSGSYYITIKHRNHLETTTAATVSFSGGTISYAFDLPTKVYGNNVILMAGGGTHYAIYGGDVTQDNLIDGGDMTPIDNLNFSFGYGNLEDTNSDGIIDAGDMTIVDNNAYNFIGAILP